jgi:thioredoxin
MKILASIIISLSILSACGDSNAENKYTNNSTSKVVKESKKSNSTSEKKSLLFFINPSGYPCQMQDKILQENNSEITAYADIIYLKTNVQSDRDKFYQYGIRTIPLLIILDKNKNEIRRLTPGIHDKDSILSAIK